MKILLLCNYDPYNAAMVTDHINALYADSVHDVTVFTYMVNHGGNLPEDVALDLFDAVILHYSLFLAVDAYVSEKSRQKLKVFAGVKAIFLQDEYRFVQASVQLIRELGFDVIFTCVPEQSIDQVYPSALLPNVKRVNVLTGYVPASLVNYQPIPLQRRRFDVSYRGRQYPEWHGRQGLEKWHIAEAFLKEGKQYGLRMNISCRERDRVYGSGWVSLLQNSKAVLGVESGASVFDFTGEVSARVDTVSSLLGKRNEHYEELRERYFSGLEDQISLAQISPRIFEAIALRTLCILYEGEYSGILEPNRHYLPLKKDHSNIGEIVQILRDPWRCAEIIADAYAEVALNPVYSYRAFVRSVDAVLSECQVNKQTAGSIVVATRTPEHVADVSGSIEAIRKKHPFYYVPNPHGLASPAPRMMRLIATGLRRTVPVRWTRVLRNLFR
jgi:hypothetical protein